MIISIGVCGHCILYNAIPDSFDICFQEAAECGLCDGTIVQDPIWDMFKNTHKNRKK